MGLKESPRGTANRGNDQLVHPGNALLTSSPVSRVQSTNDGKGEASITVFIERVDRMQLLRDLGPGILL